MLRGPEPAATHASPLRLTPALPPDPGPAPAIAWIGAVSSLVGGAVVAIVFSPLFAILAAVSAVTLIGRSIAARLGNRRANRRRREAIDEARRDLRRALDEWTEGEEHRRRTTPLADVRRALVAGAMPWQRRLPVDAVIPLTVGIGRIDVPAPAHHVIDDVLVGHLPNRCVLERVPIVTELGSAAGVGLVGSREDVLGAARSMVCEAVATYGPVDLRLVVVTTTDRLVDWDWCKWIPNLIGVAIDHASADRLLETVEDETAGNVVMAVIDGLEPNGPGALARVMSGRSPRSRSVWIGDRIDVPAACTSIAEIHADESVTLDAVSALGSVDQPTEPTTGRVGAISLAGATEVARCLAPFDDPLVNDAGGRLPDTASLSDMVGETIDPRSVWRRADRSKVIAPIGLDLDGIVEIDLVRDGPHALIAGTTGSGKSELARTLVVSAALHQPPELVSFVLVDFKGGGAFDIVADLPHVASIVTDLDAASASRALRALRAELRAREERLRELGVSDIEAVPIKLDRGDALPRLIIVVDEFAALADELPDFLDGLVDVARRGRSLGVHLILATQRPAGVVTGQVRANTNLRICLRVQDRSDSMDVIDRADAAQLPPIPGRAIVDCGGRVSEFQVAQVSGGETREDIAPFVIHPALLAADASLGPKFRAAEKAYRSLMAQEQPSASESMVDDSPADHTAPTLDERIAACAAAARWHPDPPWLAPLTEVDLDAIRSPDSVPLGLIDDPDHRARQPLVWRSRETGLLVVGADPGETEKTILVALAGQFMAQPDLHAWVFDGNGGLACLDAVPGVGAVVGVGEGARAVKLLQRLRQPSPRAGQRVPSCVVVHRWSAVADSVEAEAGLDASVALERLVREAVDRGVAVIVSGVDERDVPTRVANRISDRVVHRLATPSSYLAFDIRERQTESLVGRCVVEPSTSRRGLVGQVTLDHVIASSTPTVHPRPVEVLGDRVDRARILDLVPDEPDAMPIGLDEDLEPAMVALDAMRPVVILGQPGSGRSTAIATLLASRNHRAVPRVIDDGERVAEGDGIAAIAAAREAGEPLIIAATPSVARGFGSWIAPLLDTATVVLLNPARSDGEVCRILVPDLREAPTGRAVLVDRGRTSIIQVAA